MAEYNNCSDPNQNNWEDFIHYPEDDVIEDDVLEHVIEPTLRDPVDPAQVDASFPTYTNPPSSQPPAFQVQNTLWEPAFVPRFSQFSNFPTGHTQNQYLPTPRNSVPVPGYSVVARDSASTAGISAFSTGFPDSNSGYTIPPSSNPIPTPSHPVDTPNYHDSTSEYPVLPAPVYQIVPTSRGTLALPIPGNHGPPSTNTSPAATVSAFTGSSPAVYPNPNDVSSQTPGTTPGEEAKRNITQY